MVELAASASTGVVDAPVIVAYDAALLKFLDASPGDFLNRDGTQVMFLVNAAQTGKVILGIGRTERLHGMSGKGILCRLRFSATAKGQGFIRTEQAMAWGEDGAPLAVEVNSIYVESH